MLELGRCVRHSARPEWGLGVVTKVSATHVEVAFERRALAKITLELASKLVAIERAEIAPDSPLLDPSRWDELALAPEQRPLSATLPERVMRDVLWAFSGSSYDTLDAFVSAVWQYQQDVTERSLTPEERWQPGQVVLPVSRVRVRYLCWRGSRQLEPVVSLTSEGPGFEAGALLWKIHNAVLDDLVRDDHKFFEGLSLASAGSPAEGPLYQLSLGS
jgi:hypothetical protein